MGGGGGARGRGGNDEIMVRDEMKDICQLCRTRVRPSEIKLLLWSGSHYTY